MKKNIRSKKILAGLLVGFCCRIVFEQVKNSMMVGFWGHKHNYKQSKENCGTCHVNDVCNICPPSKVKVKDKLLKSAYKPKGMYEVTRWSVFDNSNIYDIINGEPKTPSKGIYTEEIKKTTKVAMEYLNSNQMLGKMWSLKEVCNVYFRTDSSLGTEYLLDLQVEPIRKVYNQINGLINEEEMFRIHLQHPLHPINDISNDWISISHNMKRKVKVIIPISQVMSSYSNTFINDQMFHHILLQIQTQKFFSSSLQECY